MSQTDQEQRLDLVRQFGTFTQAYSTAVQAELVYFWHADSYLAYRRKWGVACALADPIGPAEQHAPLLSAFLKQFRKTCFWQIGRVARLRSCRSWVSGLTRWAATRGSTWPTILSAAARKNGCGMRPTGWRNTVSSCAKAPTPIDINVEQIRAAVGNLAVVATHETQRAFF